ncbi:MAG: Na+/H+ antiporter NhaC family protein [Bacteroidales bacterium]|jgi:NhaC family Na+:H+ antiporter|nr:Na+/H+ antiporter NhaC family protein [Bacteroidales bacterium]MDD3272761.1 Na+/H+ antiporter NhaC family protein [Bacteroidales bacterium]
MKKPGLALSLLPIILLVTMITIGVRLFGDEISSGTSQISLLFATIITSVISIVLLKIPWSKIEEGMMNHLSKTGSAIFILLMIGALTGSWMISGVVPAMIYYGLKLIHPAVFLVVTYLLTAVVSLMAGSSWTTVGTIGVAMLSAGQILGIPTPWLAGAIISGAYFGDKLSPLSDTTNLAAAVAGVDLYTHIKFMLITVTPAFIIALVIYAIAGFVLPISSTTNIEANLGSISSVFKISPFLLLVPIFTIILIVKKVSPFITLFLSAVVGALVASFFQPELCKEIAGDGIEGGVVYFVASLKMMYGSVSIETGDAILNSLTATKGMAGMLNTVWLILCVVTFGGAMEASGMIQVITERMVRLVKSTFSLVGSTVATTLFCNITLSDQYMAILLPGKMFSETYKKMGYEPQLLSRTLEDSGTVTSVLIPWNTCGVAQSGVLGVATLAYLPYSFFNLLTPVMTLLVAAIGYKIKRKL